MFSSQEIAHFRAFGFVVLRGLLDPGEAATLGEEVATALADAYGRVGAAADTSGTGGLSGDYLPLSVDRAPLSQALIADDARLFQGSTALLGRQTVPTVPIATCFTSNAGWHTDDGTDVGGIKFLVHLERRTTGNGALSVVPGSHHPGYAALLRQYQAQDPAGQGFAGWPVPSAILETQPGDAIAFDVHLLHASEGGEDRLAWTIEYLPWPGLRDAERLRAVHDVIVDCVGYDDHGYDRERWPTWREWAAGAASSPSRQTAVERLRLLGVLGEGDPR